MSTRMFATLPMRGMPVLGHWGPFFDVETDPTPKSTAADILTRFSGDAVRMAEQVSKLENDNYKQRDEIRDYKSKITTLEGKVPADGAIVLTGDDASHWTAYQALGKPDEITKKITDGTTAQQERDTLVRTAAVRDAADVTGFDADVLKERLGELLPEMREVDQDGKKVRQAFVKDGATDVPLAQYAEQKWPKYLPALKQGGTQQTGVQFVPQTGNAAPAAGIDQYITKLQEQRDARGANPLKPT